MLCSCINTAKRRNSYSLIISLPNQMEFKMPLQKKNFSAETKPLERNKPQRAWFIAPDDFLCNPSLWNYFNLVLFKESFIPLAAGAPFQPAKFIRSLLSPIVQRPSIIRSHARPKRKRRQSLCISIFSRLADNVSYGPCSFSELFIRFNTACRSNETSTNFNKNCQLFLKWTAARKTKRVWKRLFCCRVRRALAQA